MKIEMKSPARGRYKLTVGGTTLLVWDHKTIVVNLKEQSKLFTLHINKASRQYKLGLDARRENRQLIVRFDGERQEIPDTGVLKIRLVEDEVHND